MIHSVRSCCLSQRASSPERSEDPWPGVTHERGDSLKEPHGRERATLICEAICPRLEAQGPRPVGPGCSRVIPAVGYVFKGDITLLS